MAFNQTNASVRVTTIRHDRQVQQISGRGRGRPIRNSPETIALVEFEGRRVLGIDRS